MTSNHTPTPWKLHQGYVAGPDDSLIIHLGNRADKERFQRDMEFVCNTVNLRHELISKLQISLNMMRNSMDTERFGPAFLDSIEELISRTKELGG